MLPDSKAPCACNCVHCQFGRHGKHCDPRSPSERRAARPSVASANDECAAWIEPRIHCTFVDGHPGTHSFETASFMEIQTRLRAVANGEADPDVVARDFSTEMIAMLGNAHARSVRRTDYPEAMPETLKQALVAWRDRLKKAPYNLDWKEVDAVCNELIAAVEELSSTTQPEK